MKVFLAMTDLGLALQVQKLPKLPRHVQQAVDIGPNCHRPVVTGNITVLCGARIVIENEVEHAQEEGGSVSVLGKGVRVPLQQPRLLSLLQGCYQHWQKLHHLLNKLSNTYFSIGLPST